MNVPIAGADILILGASYREDVGDTRYSGSEMLVRKLAEMGAEIRVPTTLMSTSGGNSRTRMFIPRKARMFFSGIRKS